MNPAQFFSKHGLLLVGDVFTLVVVTILGFASHAALDAGPRMLATFVPLLAAWLLIAPHLRVYHRETTQEPNQLWRPFWAMWLAAPMAGWLRGVLLGTAVLPVFVFILGGVGAFSILLWRSIYYLITVRKEQPNG
jgi:hypothetical protein